MKPFRWLRAFITGYFWLPCPRCGRMFGGYEHGGNVDIGNGKGLMTCKRCPDFYDADLNRIGTARPVKL